MFDRLTQKLGEVFDKLRGKGALTEQDVQTTLRQIRMAFLEADVALPALKALMEGVQERAVGEKLLKSVSPAQLVIKIVHDELIRLLTHPNQDLYTYPHGPTRFLMVGLQGSGKTTMTAKLAFLLKKKKVLMVSLDTYRPAARLQLEQLGKEISVETLPILSMDETPLAIARRALTREGAYDSIIFDTAGRLHVSESMMDEIKEIEKLVQPHEILFVADALSGQDILVTAQAFSQALKLTGICLSRIDGDSRGGAALSLRYCTQCPIKLMGVGEHPSQVLPFDPRRLADRILDQGDIVGLVEKAAQVLSEQEQQKTLQRLQKGIFTLEDFAQKIQEIEAMGGLKGFLNFLPGMRTLREKFQERLDKASFKRQLAIISSMTKKERRCWQLLNASRKQRIAKGSGTQVSDINQLLRQFEQMQKMLKHFQKGPWT